MTKDRMAAILKDMYSGTLEDLLRKTNRIAAWGIYDKNP
jgi:hypothetical protein